MEFKIEKNININLKRYDKKDIDTAYEFAKQIYKEFKELVKAVVVFGSSTRGKNPKGDIDVLIVVDDLSIKMSQEVTEAYRVIVEKTMLNVSKRLHITTLKLTTFWEHVKSGDPIAINILRDGFALIDTGFVEPLQALLAQGRIRPTKESVWTYFSRAPATLQNSKWHLLQATLDLYWSVIDASHAALMSLNVIPPSPSHVADLLEQKLVKKKLLPKKHANTMRNFYKLSRMILHRELKEIKGEEYEIYYKEAKEFVDFMKKFIEDREIK